MALFQKSIVEKYLRTLDDAVIEQAYENYSTVYVPKINRIKELKEEQYQTQFLQDIFGSVLGYTVDPEEGFNIELEKKNEKDSKKVDGAILKDDSVLGVIELKSTKTTDLEKVKDQAFGYKNNHKGCKYVISSNFHKLRFYVDDATEYEEFDLFNLSKTEFRKFYLYLRKEGLLDKDVPKQLKEETKFHEENISKQLYKDYSTFKNRFFENLVKNNPQHDKLILFKKSQKFLDRILFVLFAEDKDLIPENAISRIVESWAQADDLHYKPLYDLFKIFFEHLNVGHKYKSGYEIPAYNGGLFAPDEILDNIIVDDEVLKDDLLILSKYDFNSEVDVNILGHIFEHSLSEIEEVEAELRGEVSDKSKSKRKKDGVFYTPKYITKYIVDNTIGKLCLEKRDELGIIDEEYAKGRKNRKKETIQTLSKNLEEYRNWLLNITICDPACGSGAFLNQALEFLIKEHQYIDELESQLLDSPIVFNWVEDHILEKNLFGVDINDESVEIARLSLWLRTAKKGRKLTALNNNIKCGNSLIDDSKVAGDKAFKWEDEFSEVFAKGGFDVVIGNPPYVNVELIPVNDKNFYRKNYQTFYKRYDLFALFVELSISKLTSTGRVGFIIPSIILNNLSYKKIRDLILNNNWLEEVCYTGGKVFDDATVDSTILLLNKTNNFNEIRLNNALDFFNPIYQSVPLDYFDKYDRNISVGHGEANNITDKLFLDEFLTCEDHFQVFQGVVTGNNDVFVFDSLERAKSKIGETGLLKPMCHGRDISKWIVSENKRQMLYITSETNINEYPSTLKYLETFQDKLSHSKSSTEKSSDWYCLHRPRVKSELEIAPKILIQNTRNERLQPRIVATIDTKGLFGTQGLNFIIPIGNIDVYYLLGLLNSKLINYLFSTKFLNLAIKAEYLKKLKFPKEIAETKINEQAKELSQMYATFDTEIKNFIQLLQNKYSIEKVSKKLTAWYELDFSGLLKEFKKVKLTLDLLDEEKLMIYFEEKKANAVNLKTSIDVLEREMNNSVYNLYGLTEEEIKIVEES